MSKPYAQAYTFTSPRRQEATFLCRPDTNDYNLVRSIFAGDVDEYGLGKHTLSGWAVDIGAHIGSVALALAIDNPDLKVLAVEFVPENAALLRANVLSNGLTDRVIVVERAATRPGVPCVPCWFGYRSWGGHDESYTQAHRFIGNQYRDEGDPSDTVEVEATSLEALLAEYDIERLAFLKIDCEGCEWDFLDSTALGAVEYIIGEIHAGIENPAEASDEEHDTGWKPGQHKCHDMAGHLHRLLDATHDVTISENLEIFTATRR